MSTMYIPEIIQCDVSIDAKPSKVIEPTSETYDAFHIQYSANLLLFIQLYRSEYSPAL